MKENASDALEIHDMTVSYNKRPVLWGVDMHMPKGVMACVLGPNGAGKSTLLKAILGLIPADSGWAKIEGKSIEAMRETISYIPQKESVDWDFPIQVIDVVLMGRFRPKKFFFRYSKEDMRLAEEALEKVGMSQFAKRQIAQLSGGQQQRVFIARALAQGSTFFFMDEPFSGVDKTTEETIINIMKGLSAEGKTLLVVHHDIQSVSKYFDYGILLNTRLVANGYIKDVFTPANLQETFGGQLTILDEVAKLRQQN
jgi:manganese/zinc/iron transport system ATP- binding protein